MALGRSRTPFGLDGVLFLVKFIVTFYFFEKLGVVLPDFVDLSAAGGFLGFGASEVVDGGEDGDA